MDFRFKKDRLYYFPTTKNIAFVMGEWYVCLGDGCTYAGFKKNNKYKVVGFLQGNLSTIFFVDINGKELGISPFDIGSFRSLKEHRKLKLIKIKQNVGNIFGCSF